MLFQEILQLKLSNSICSSSKCIWLSLHMITHYPSHPAVSLLIDQQCISWTHGELRLVQDWCWNACKSYFKLCLKISKYSLLLSWIRRKIKMHDFRQHRNRQKQPMKRTTRKVVANWHRRSNRNSIYTCFPWESIGLTQKKQCNTICLRCAACFPSDPWNCVSFLPQPRAINFPEEEIILIVEHSQIIP